MTAPRSSKRSSCPPGASDASGLAADEALFSALVGFWSSWSRSTTSQGHDIAGTLACPVKPLLSAQSPRKPRPYLLADQGGNNDKDRETSRIAPPRRGAGCGPDGGAAGHTFEQCERGENSTGGEGDAQPDARQAHPRDAGRDDALLAERRAARPLHLHDVGLRFALEAAHGPGRREADGRQRPLDGEAPRRQAPGGGEGRSAG